MRRWQRRRRSWWRHEQQSVAAALATAHHHICDRKGKTKVVECEGREEAGSETYDAPRGSKTLPPGMRPAPPSEVAEPQVVAATVGYVVVGAPLLAVSSLRGADGVDDTSVKYFLRAELKKKKEEEERKQQEMHERRMQLLNQRVGLDLPLTEAEWAAWRQWMGIVPSSSSSAGKRRKRKKRKKRLPRTRRLPRQWHVRCAGFAGNDAPRVMLPSVVDRPQMVGIMACMYQKDSSALFVDSGSGVCKVLLVTVDLVYVSFCCWQA